MSSLTHSPVKVKICGLTTLEDARHAAASGADYLGFILYPPSPRAISPASLKPLIQQIRATLPTPPRLVGVFVNETATSVAQKLDELGLDLAQLHGDEVPWMVGSPDSPLFGRCYKALRPTSLAEAEAEAEWYLPPDWQEDRPALLMDAYHPTLRGGTGATADWAIMAQLAQTVPGLLLAGGLTPDNVAEAVRQVQPYGVDVASGVETQPGVKGREKVARFIAAAKKP
ncbi:MAG: phosphoribosylanthranilate isomerase [Chloroflexi bacterium]|nr:phosphoribosylanthranilate isomerase [Chloroflexota bacterium]